MPKPLLKSAGHFATHLHTSSSFWAVFVFLTYLAALLFTGGFVPFLHTSYFSPHVNA